MEKSYLISLLILFQVDVKGQTFSGREYSGIFTISDSISYPMLLKLNADQTFMIDANFMKAQGKWKITNNKNLVLKTTYSEHGCFISHKTKTIKMEMQEGRIVWEDQSTPEQRKRQLRKMQRQHRRSTGEELQIESIDQNSVPIILKQIN